MLRRLAQRVLGGRRITFGPDISLGNIVRDASIVIYRALPHSQLLDVYKRLAHASIGVTRLVGTCLPRLPLGSGG